MDSEGRLHMPGFVGETFEKTGVLRQRNQEAALMEHRPNRKQRRAQEAIDRLSRKSKAAAGETV